MFAQNYPEPFGIVWSWPKSAGVLRSQGHPEAFGVIRSCPEFGVIPSRPESSCVIRSPLESSGVVMSRPESTRV